MFRFSHWSNTFVNYLARLVVNLWYQIFEISFYKEKEVLLYTYNLYTTAHLRFEVLIRYLGSGDSFRLSGVSFIKNISYYRRNHCRHYYSVTFHTLLKEMLGHTPN